MKSTGRLLAGPGGSLVELTDDRDLKHMAVVFDPAYRDHPCLNGDLEQRIGFMEAPEVTGLARMVAHTPEEGAFVYPTGTVWSVAEVVRELASMGEVGGVKAALELCFMTGEILVEAADKAVHSGLDGHGSLDPWKLLLKADGQVLLLGYGLPRPEVEVFLEDENRLPSEDSLRYCAPETLAEEPSADISSDLFSLTLVALELMVGRPVYDGLVADVRKQAQRGEAVRRLYQWRDRIPETVREVLGKALKPDPDIRYRDGLDFVYSVHDLLGGIDAGDGPSLREVVTRVRSRQKRGRAVVGGNTGALTMAELAELAADIDEAGVATRLPEPRRPRPDGSDDEDEGAEKPRWRRASRGNNAPEPEPASPRARRGRDDDGGAGASGTSGDARERLLRRLRDRGPTPSAGGDDTRTRRRRPTAEGEDATIPDRPRRRGRPEREPLDRTPRTKPLEVDEDDEATQVQEPPPSLETSAVLAKAEAREAKVDTLTSRENDTLSDTTRRRRPGGRAAALLERLRSTSGGHTTSSMPSDEDEPPAEPMPPPPPEPEPEVRRPAAEDATVTALPKPAAPPLPPEDDADGATDDEELETAVIPVEALPPEVRGGAEPLVVPDFEATVVATKPPIPPPNVVSAVPHAPTEQGVRVEFAGRTATVPSGPALVVREAALDALGLSETDVLGRQVCYYRLDGAHGGVVNGSARLVRVENAVRMALVEVPGDPATRVRTPVGTAIPVRRIKRALTDLLQLTGPVKLAVGGAVLDDDALLGDHSGDGELRIRVER
ncbi:MAG: hypothetical protein H6737_07995 [Alphaproteobacteria bacterium]|nr:hypothetical protein [Alphaproteobacteria bacterium]